MDATRHLTDLEQVALLIAARLGRVIEVVPPRSQSDIVSFTLAVSDQEAAAAALGAFSAGTLDGNLSEFSDALDHVRRMVRDSRNAAGYGRPKP